MPAQWQTFGPFFHNGALVTAPRLYHYAAGTTVEKVCWTDRAKTVTAPQPLIGDANGLIAAYFEGAYKLAVTTSTGTPLATWDNCFFAESPVRLEGSLSVGETNLIPGETVTLPTIAVDGALVGQWVQVYPPVALPRVSIYGFVSAPGVVTVQLYAALAGLTGQAVFPSFVINATSGLATGYTIPVAGAVVGDAVLACPPYPLNGILYTASVDATNTVAVWFYNTRSSPITVPEGTWVAMVMKRNAVIIPAGIWRVVVLSA